MNSPPTEDGAITPTKEFSMYDGMLHVKCYGLKTGNWKMKSRSTSEEFNLALDVNQNVTTYEKIEKIAGDSGLSHIFFPRPSSFNGQVCFEKLYAWPETCLSGGLRISRGPLYDGVIIDPTSEPNTGFLITTADCPTVVVYNEKTGRFVVTHAGRWSVIDKSNAHNRKFGRDFEGTLEWAIHAHKKVAHWRRESFYTEDLHAFVCCGIKNGFMHSLTHPQHGADNKKLWKHLQRLLPKCPPEEYRLGDDLLLEQFIAKRLELLGLKSDHIVIDDIDTLNDRDATGKPVWASAVRNQNERNAVLVYQKP